jgi:hypothetical protein
MALAVVSLAVAMIEPAFQALLMTAIGPPPLLQASLLPAGETAIALSVVTVGTQKKQRAASPGKTKPLPQNHFTVRRHTSSQAALDKGSGFVAG